MSTICIKIFVWENAGDIDWEAVQWVAWRFKGGEGGGQEEKGRQILSRTDYGLGQCGCVWYCSLWLSNIIAKILGLVYTDSVETRPGTLHHLIILYKIWWFEWFLLYKYVCVFRSALKFLRKSNIRMLNSCKASLTCLLGHFDSGVYKREKESFFSFFLLIFFMIVLVIVIFFYNFLILNKDGKWMAFDRAGLLYIKLIFFCIL